MRKGKRRMVFALTVVVVICITAYIAWIRIGKQRAVAPLLSYAQTHWFNLRERGVVTDVIQPRGRKRLTKIRVCAPTYELFMIVYAERLGYQRWRLRGNQDVTDWRITAEAFGSHTGVAATNVNSALKLVRMLAVERPKLSQAVVRRVNGRACFCFWSARARGIYVVYKDEMVVYFLQKRSVDVP